MSIALVEFIRSFNRGETPLDSFVDEYPRRWRTERDSGVLDEDRPVVQELNSTVFCLIDMFNPEPDAFDYELDAQQLKQEVAKALEKAGLPAFKSKPAD
jgi:hypothetical protein